MLQISGLTLASYMGLKKVDDKYNGMSACSFVKEQSSPIPYRGTCAAHCITGLTGATCLGQRGIAPLSVILCILIPVPPRKTDSNRRAQNTTKLSELLLFCVAVRPKTDIERFVVISPPEDELSVHVASFLTSNTRILAHLVEKLFGVMPSSVKEVVVR